MTTARVRTICPHCKAVLEIDRRSSSSVAICGACDADVEFDRSSRNTPATINHSSPGDSALRSFPIVPALDGILVKAIVFLREHWLVLLLTSVAANLIWFVLIGWPINMLREGWSQLGREDGGSLSLGTLLSGSAITGFLLVPVSAYTLVVLVRLSLEITRYGATLQTENKLSQIVNALRVPFSIIMRMTGLLLMVATLFAFTSFIGLIATVCLSFAMDQQTAVWVGTLFVGALLVGIIFLLQWLLWPTVFFISDGRADLITATQWGAGLSMRHRKLTVSLVTIYFVLATAGSMLFYVGQILTTPIATLPLAIGYLRMTGGEYDRSETLTSSEDS
ncbi:hypothetical protein [Rhodopirellula sallentina]|uniref:Putative membrane protein n=1 Tax=Rhodopirellula sallentina SM41 TaxID=1263870 RepID=M5UBZ1_9BACT|nr:hypothetical protein [Rhodopirellula sallentina]EMI55371.1 putative membrane protein [Rhodopirellula sallentina SM41]